MTTIYEQWQEGTLTDMEALRALLSDLRETESSIAPLAAERDQIREAISHIAARSPSPIEVAGLGRVSMTAPSVSTSYDTKQIDALIKVLRTTHPDIAALISECQKTTERSGGLRIEKAKGL